MPDTGIQNTAPTVTNPPNTMPPLRSRSTFVTGLALVSMIVGLFLSVTDITGLISYVSLTNSAEYQMATRLMQTYRMDSGSMSLNSGWIMTSSVISLVLNAATIVISFALFRRMKWGRISFITLVWVQTVYYIASSIGGYYMAQSFLGNPGIAQLVGGSSIMAFGEFALVGSIVVVVATALFIVWKLSSKEVRGEFGK